MLSVLINAYACAPNMGSEPGMAWNWIIHLAQYCKLHVITEGEWQAELEQAIKELPQGENIKFYYLPVSDKIRQMCWNQGDWRFYEHYKTWQKEALSVANQIIKDNSIDVVHQLNMIGFREPGYLWRIEGIPFVWGPIGGLKQFPLAYALGGGIKQTLFSALKNFINVLQIKYDYRVNKALMRADLLISAVPNSYTAIKKHKKIDSIIIPETGCFDSAFLASKCFTGEEFNILWVGKFDFRKQLPLALKTIASIQNEKIKLHIFGAGSDSQENSLRRLSNELNLKSRIIWHGNQSNAEVQEFMRQSHLFFFTSVSDDTSTVVLEAISNGLPVLCFDACGFGNVINDKVGRKVPFTNPKQSIKDFAIQIQRLYDDRTLLQQMSDNCKQRKVELSWNNKAQQMFNLYKEAIVSHLNAQ